MRRQGCRRAEGSFLETAYTNLPSSCVVQTLLLSAHSVSSIGTGKGKDMNSIDNRFFPSSSSVIVFPNLRPEASTSSGLVSSQACTAVSDALLAGVLIPTLLFIVAGIVMITTGCVILRDKQHNDAGFLALVIVGSVLLGVNVIALAAYAPVLAATKPVCKSVL